MHIIINYDKIPFFQWWKFATVVIEPLLVKITRHKKIKAYCPLKNIVKST